MNDSPGWATPGSPSDGEGSDGSRPPAQPADTSKWSASQPPPGQWSSPAAGQTPPPQQQGPGWGPYAPRPGQQPGHQPGGPYGGPYGHPGGAGGWGGPPPAAKPGVIPLRPLGLGEILDGAVSSLRGHWKTVLSVSLVAAVLVQLGLLGVQRLMRDRLVVSPEPTTPGELADTMGDTLIAGYANYYLQLLGLLLVTGLLAGVVSSAVLGRSTTVAAHLRGVRPLVPRMLGLVGLLLLGSLAAGLVPVLPGLLTGNGVLAVLGAPVGIVLLAWFFVTFVLALPALMMERGKVADALKRSAKLVKGSWWRIFGISALTWAITWITSMIIAVPFAAVAVLVSPGGLSDILDGTSAQSWTFLLITAIGGLISLTITVPMQTGVTSLLYIDQRIRREALDLELARAAGVHDQGDHGAVTQRPGGAGPASGG
ncbi:glycerophosphoryl diester phosphodiesterase membrane domain-containing protein [Streptomyces sp. NPDC057939]|uniref:glycerophosphoryl diester phosphodiesterase membrane domain-containing protein n=1 Tax=Streptomyces sp. NPDC057939 TaxID=3346284 RepID=UPI0036EF5981